MSRAYLIFIVIAGMFGAMLNNCSSPGSMRSSGVFEEQASRSTSGRSETSASRIPAQTFSEGAIELQRKDDGHFYADVQINGATIHALVDTGATEIALSRADAGSAGIGTSIGMPEVIGEGADGAVHGEVVRLDRVSLGHRSAEGMSAVVLSSGAQTLLGQSFLSKFDSVEIRGDTMVLK
jgi:aspartyl protease family protein